MRPNQELEKVKHAENFHFILTKFIVFSANMVESEDGKKTLLNATDPNQRHAIAKRLLTPSHSSLPLSQNKKVQSLLTSFVIYTEVKLIPVVCCTSLSLVYSLHSYSRYRCRFKTFWRGQAKLAF